MAIFRRSKRDDGTARPPAHHQRPAYKREEQAEMDESGRGGILGGHLAGSEDVSRYGSDQGIDPAARDELRADADYESDGARELAIEEEHRLIDRDY